VYEILGVSLLRSRLHVAAARGLTRFVGRNTEMEQLRRALAGKGHMAMFTTTANKFCEALRYFVRTGGVPES
jgi:hypothetical protein